MSGIRPVGAGLPNLLKINGQAIETGNEVPVESPRLPAGLGGPATQRPVEPPSDPYSLQEGAYDEADEASIRGANASAQLFSGKRRRSRARPLGEKKSTGEEQHRRVVGVFADGDPHNRQEKAYSVAAEFEEKVKESDLSFARRAAQVEVGDVVYTADLDDGKGAIVAGETSFEFMVGGDTVPDAPIPTYSDTALRRALGLGGEKNKG